MNIDFEKIALAVKAAQDNTTYLEPITSQYPNFDLEDAYQVAALVHQMRLDEGASVVGRKIGFTNANMWEVYGVEAPIWSYMYDTTVENAAEIHTCSIASYVEPKIEPEIVLHFSKTPPINATASELLACIDWVANGIEVVQSHFKGWQFKAADTVVDAGLHAKLVVSTPVNIEPLGSHVFQDLQDFELSLFCDAQLYEVGKGENALGNPVLAALHLISVLSQQPDTPPLQAGELVTTGTLTAAYPMVTGQVWNTSVEGIDLSPMHMKVV